MGGGSYFSDVHEARQNLSASRSADDAFNYSRMASTGTVKGIHRDVVAKTIRECCDSSEHPATTPIVLASDITDSRGDDAKVIFEKLPSLMAALRLSNVVPDPQILWAAFGDAYSDRAAIQVCQFEADRRLDEWLGKLWLEGGGGGTGEESSELMAYYLAYRTRLDATARNVKGFAFFTTDEAPYPVVSKSQVSSILGVEIPKDLPSETAFRDLQKLYHPFVIFPRASMAQRKKGIDSEVKARLERLGGRFKEVDLRATLLWNTRDDLDIHIRTPSGEEIFFGNKKGRCRGELDVDRNIRGEDPKPVENIRWAAGTAEKGEYEVWVELYRYHEQFGKPVNFTIHIDNGGTPIEIVGSVGGSRSESHKSQPTRIVFTGRQDSKAEDPYAAYAEDVILEKWGRYVPPTQILKIDHPESIIEVMLGTMALKGGKMDLSDFQANMQERKVPKVTREDVVAALDNFAKKGLVQQITSSVFQ